MSGFVPVRRIAVCRRLSSGDLVPVGELAQNRQGVFFQYHSDYLLAYPSLSPFMLPFNRSLHRAPAQPHQGLHGVFADSLPDGWGLRLMDRVFRRRGISPSELSAMDRLAYIGSRGLGALEYGPVSDFAPVSGPGEDVDLTELGEQARALFDDESRDVSPSLAFAGSSGGMRPKAQVYLPAGGSLAGASIREGPGMEPWLVKFTSASLPLGHEESLCEAAYLRMAEKAGIEVPEWRLIPVSKSHRRSLAAAWLAVKRFDCSPEGGRLHMHSLCGLLDADFRAPSMDYEDLIKASQTLCRSSAVGHSVFVRAMFNLFAVNQDDHTKNWAFLQDDAGNWRLSPCYDVTFSPSPQGEHSTAFLGHGAAPPLKAVQQMAQQANFPSWGRAVEVVERVVEALGHWQAIAADIGVSKDTQRLVGRRLNAAYGDNRALLNG